MQFVCRCTSEAWPLDPDQITNLPDIDLATEVSIASAIGIIELLIRNDIDNHVKVS